MMPPTALSFEEILKFMLAHNGKVTNHELVKHFKVFLTNPDMRDEARNTFKKHVNTLAIIKSQNNEKLLILKKKYMQNTNKENEEFSESKPADTPSSSSTLEPPPTDTAIRPPYRPPPPVQLNQDFNILTNLIHGIDEPSIKSPPTMTPSESKESLTYPAEDVPPKVHPRRRSSDKPLTEKRASITSQTHQRSSIPNQDTIEMDESVPPMLTTSRSESMLIDNEQKISVKERKQMFNRMASESDVLKTNRVGGTFSPQGVDEDDRVSLDQKSEAYPFSPKEKQWVLCAARGEYHALAKMIKDSPNLVGTKDPFTTAMHWACKRGDENLVKLLAGTDRQLINKRSGYTPLHIAMQFDHENVFRLLTEVYDADANVRDWSGRKPRQYSVHTNTSLSPGCFRKAENYDMRRNVTSLPAIRVTSNTLNPVSKKESFLRMGSLNVRVKKTTEAFTNFLGVGATRSSAYIPKSAKEREERRSDDGELHKTWGSADNIQKDDKLMPPPMSSKVRRRGASGRKGLAAHSRSTPTTPDQPRAQIGVSEEGDSDSDSAAGFHSAWRQQRASNLT